MEVPKKASRPLWAADLEPGQHLVVAARTGFAAAFAAHWLIARAEFIALALRGGAKAVATRRVGVHRSRCLHSMHFRPPPRDASDMREGRSAAVAVASAFPGRRFLVVRE